MAVVLPETWIKMWGSVKPDPSLCAWCRRKRQYIWHLAHMKWVPDMRYVWDPEFCSHWCYLKFIDS